LGKNNNWGRETKQIALNSREISGERGLKTIKGEEEFKRLQKIDREDVREVDESIVKALARMLKGTALFVLSVISDEKN